MWHPVLFLILSVVLLFAKQCQPNPMLKSPEEHQEKTPQFWSFFLQPVGQFETKDPEMIENLEAEQGILGKQQKQEEINTSELGRRVEPDYYDAVKEEEEDGQKQQNNRTAENSLLNMMAALQVNVDPPPIILIDGTVGKEKSKEKPQKMKLIVFPTKGKYEKMRMLDGDTYDDERMEMGKADEEKEEEEIGNGTSKIIKKEQPADIALLLEGRESLAGEIVGRTMEKIDGQTNGGRAISDEEGDGGGEWPVVDGETGKEQLGMIDGKMGREKLEQPPRAKIFGMV